MKLLSLSVPLFLIGATSCWHSPVVMERDTKADVIRRYFKNAEGNPFDHAADLNAILDKPNVSAELRSGFFNSYLNQNQPSNLKAPLKSKVFGMYNQRIDCFLISALQVVLRMSNVRDLLIDTVTPPDDFSIDENAYHQSVRRLLRVDLDVHRMLTARLAELGPIARLRLTSHVQLIRKMVYVQSTREYALLNQLFLLAFKINYAEVVSEDEITEILSDIKSVIDILGLERGVQEDSASIHGKLIALFNKVFSPARHDTIVEKSLLPVTDTIISCRECQTSVTQFQNPFSFNFIGDPNVEADISTLFSAEMLSSSISNVTNHPGGGSHQVETSKKNFKLPGSIFMGFARDFSDRNAPQFKVPLSEQISLPEPKYGLITGITQNEFVDRKYNLTGGIFYFGSNKGGHYISFVKSIDNLWCILNDSDVRCLNSLSGMIDAFRSYTSSDPREHIVAVTLEARPVDDPANGQQGQMP